MRLRPVPALALAVLTCAVTAVATLPAAAQPSPPRAPALAAPTISVPRPTIPRITVPRPTRTTTPTTAVPTTTTRPPTPTSTTPSSTTTTPSTTPSSTTTAPSTTPSAPVGVRVAEVAGGLAHPWEVGLLPDGRVLVTERAGRLHLLSGTGPGATRRQVRAPLSDVYARGEAGLMGLVVHADFARTRRFSTCQAHQAGGGPVDVRVVTWRLSASGASATRVRDPLVAGLPLNPSGRHSGCRLALDATGALLVGTGDAAIGSTPQDPRSAGGKVLRVDLATGGPAAGNPFATDPDPVRRLTYSSGHRNVQGLAVQPGTGRVYAAEHGPDRDDEVTLLRAGGNAGWDPSRGGTTTAYDESVPMTDLARFPGAVAPVWASGSPTEAVSGAAFLTGPRWGAREGLLAVAALKGQTLLLLRLGPDGAVTGVEELPELAGRYGRLRAVRAAGDGTLLVTTSGGTGDRVLRVSAG